MPAVESILLLYKRRVTDSRSSNWNHQPNPGLLAPTPAFFPWWAARMRLTQHGQGIFHRNVHAGKFFQPRISRWILCFVLENIINFSFLLFFFDCWKAQGPIPGLVSNLGNCIRSSGHIISFHLYYHSPWLLIHIFLILTWHACYKPLKITCGTR